MKEILAKLKKNGSANVVITEKFETMVMYRCVGGGTTSNCSNCHCTHCNCR